MWFVSPGFLFNIFIFLQKALLNPQMGDSGGCLGYLNAPWHKINEEYGNLNELCLCSVE